MIVSVENI